MVVVVGNVAEHREAVAQRRDQFERPDLINPEVAARAGHAQENAQRDQNRKDSLVFHGARS